jgi:hypothetical protein
MNVIDGRLSQHFLEYSRNVVRGSVDVMRQVGQLNRLAMIVHDIV